MKVPVQNFRDIIQKISLSHCAHLFGRRESVSQRFSLSLDPDTPTEIMFAHSTVRVPSIAKVDNDDIAEAFCNNVVENIKVWTTGSC